MTKDQSLCIYEVYYKLARGGSSYIEWYTIHFLSLNVLVLISILIEYFSLDSPIWKFPFSHIL